MHCLTNIIKNPASVDLWQASLLCGYSTLHRHFGRLSIALCKRFAMINPFPPLILFNRIRVSETVPSPSRGPCDRSRATVDVVWVGTNYIQTLSPTARRRTRTLGLDGAPRSTVGDVPTTAGGMVTVAARYMC